MKGIILAGGSGSRLNPITISFSKQLAPVYDKPLIYYPLCTLIMSGIKEILIITSDQDDYNFKRLLGSGEQWGLKISYEIQIKPLGIAEAFIIGKKFIGKDSVALILGDNIFYGINIDQFFFRNKLKKNRGACIFAYPVPDPSRYGVVELKKNKVISIQEKPKNPKSNYAITGLYFFDNNVVEYAKLLKPSKRNELEITDINKFYMKKNKLHCVILDSGSVWLDAGTTASLLQASQFVQTLQERQQILIGSPEETALKKGFITKKQFKKISNKFPSNHYGDLLKNVLNKK